MHLKRKNVLIIVFQCMTQRVLSLRKLLAEFLNVRPMLIYFTLIFDTVSSAGISDFPYLFRPQMYTLPFHGFLPSYLKDVFVTVFVIYLLNFPFPLLPLRRYFTTYFFDLFDGFHVSTFLDLFKQNLS